VKPSRKIRNVFVAALLSFAATATAENAEPKTIYEAAEKSWAVGTVQLGRALKFRQGQLLAFPSTINELLWAPKKTKPRNLMFIYEVPEAEKDHPYYNEHDVFFAPIRLLSEHAYWKDNLPTTRRHDVAGRRYVFRGDDIAEAKKILGGFLPATELHGRDRWKGEVRGLVAALGAHNAVLREDAVVFLSSLPQLKDGFEDTDVAAVASYLSGDAPAAEKTKLIDAAAAANLTALKPTFDELAKRTDTVGAAARKAADRLGGVADQAQAAQH